MATLRWLHWNIGHRDSSTRNGHLAPFQYPIRRLIVRSRKVSNEQDLYLGLSDRSKIWQAPRQHCCRGACQISKRCDDLHCQSRGFETSRDLTIRRLIGYWNGALSHIDDMPSWSWRTYPAAHPGCLADTTLRRPPSQSSWWQTSWLPGSSECALHFRYTPACQGRMSRWRSGTDCSTGHERSGDWKERRREC